MKLITLSFETAKSILGCGADLKGAFAFAEGNLLFLSDSFGDLEETDNFFNYEEQIRKYQKKLIPGKHIIACDMHPGYHSTRFAEKLSAASRPASFVKVQHHEAHIASLMADNLIMSPIIGIAFDGTGLGQDGNIWGGEFFIGVPKKFIRAARFNYLPMPGMDMAVSQPWRMASSYLYSSFGEDFLKLKMGFVKKLDKKKWPVIRRMIDGNINSPLTSSVGRLFDAASSMVLNKFSASYEAELPINFEKIADTSCEERYRFNISRKAGMMVINTRGIVRGIAEDIIKKEKPSVISAKFHNTLAEIIVKVSVCLRKRFDINMVGLSGGVFQNSILTDAAKRGLSEKGFNVYTHSRLSPNDSSISLGQVYIANERSGCA